MKRMLLCLVISFLAAASAVAQETPKPMADQPPAPRSELVDELIKQAEELMKRFQEGVEKLGRFADKNPPVLPEPQAADEPKAELTITKRQTLPAETEPGVRELLQELVDIQKRQPAPVTSADVERLLKAQTPAPTAKAVADEVDNRLAPLLEQLQQMNVHLEQLSKQQLSPDQIQRLAETTSRLQSAIDVANQYQQRHPALTKEDYRELKREEELEEMKSHKRQKAVEEAVSKALQRHELEKAAAAAKYRARLHETQHVAESAADRVIEAVGNEGVATRSHVTTEVEEAEEVIREEAQATREQIESACGDLETYLKSLKPQVVRVTVTPPPYIRIRIHYYRQVPIRYSWWHCGSQYYYYVWR